MRWLSDSAGESDLPILSAVRKLVAASQIQPYANAISP